MARSRSASASPRRHRSGRERSREERDGYESTRQSRRSASRERREYRGRRNDEDRRHRRSPRQDRVREASLSPPRHTKRPRYNDNNRTERPALTSESPAVGSILQGKVHTVKPFGVFVNLEGFQRHGLVHHSQVSEEVAFDQGDDDADKIAAMEYFFPVGEKVFVKVTEVQPDDRGGFKIGCSIRAVDQDTGKDLDPDNVLTYRSRGFGGQSRQGTLKEGAPELNSIHKAEVASVKPFGAFVRLEGFRINGLVHVSQVSDHMDMDKEDSDEAKVAAISQVLAVGESLWVKVVEIKEPDPGSDRGPKLGCSIKLVSQRDGSDLDPHGLKHRPRPSDGEFGQRRTVGADVGKVQEGQVDWGHLNAEKVNLDPQTSGYEILGADAENVGPERVPGFETGGNGLPPPPKKGLKKQQKLQQTGIGSVEEALAILKQHKKKSKGKKEKKQKKGKKAKKKKHSSSSSDS